MRDVYLPLLHWADCLLRPRAVVAAVRQHIRRRDAREDALEREVLAARNEALVARAELAKVEAENRELRALTSMRGFAARGWS